MQAIEQFEPDVIFSKHAMIISRLKTTVPVVVLSDTTLYGRYFSSMLERGIYLAPSQFEAAFMSVMHDAEDIAATLHAARESLKPLRA